MTYLKWKLEDNGYPIKHMSSNIMGTCDGGEHYYLIYFNGYRPQDYKAYYVNIKITGERDVFQRINLGKYKTLKNATRACINHYRIRGKNRTTNIQERL